ncbi:MAG TPA: hypothetical protein VIL69_24165 [Roseomonas sp.]
MDRAIHQNALQREFLRGPGMWSVTFGRIVPCGANSILIRNEKGALSGRKMIVRQGASSVGSDAEDHGGLIEA